MKPYYDHNGITIYHGDCREILPTLPRADCVITDPPYGETSLRWDGRITGWADMLPSSILWCFGSLRFFMEEREEFVHWKFAQDIVWRKHNGSNFHADRFRRIHEHIAQFYQGEWAAVFKNVITTPDATPHAFRRKGRPPHTGHIGEKAYQSQDGGPRLQRSVIDARSCHGYAEHPTQKPTEIITPFIEYSCPSKGVIIDCFMGSGSVLVAAKTGGRRAIGIEIEERYCEIAAKRLSQEVFEFT